MYQLNIYLINLKLGPKRILGIIVGYDEDEAVSHALNLYKDSEFVSIGKIVSWQEFKNAFVSDDWPEDFLENDSGLFNREDIIKAAVFVRELIGNALDTKYNFKIEMSAN